MLQTESPARVYGADFAIWLAGLGVKSIRTPIQAPRANAHLNAFVRGLRRECLDHILPLSIGVCRYTGCVTSA